MTNNAKPVDVRKVARSLGTDAPLIPQVMPYEIADHVRFELQGSGIYLTSAEAEQVLTHLAGAQYELSRNGTPAQGEELNRLVATIRDRVRPTSGRSGAALVAETRRDLEALGWFAFGEAPGWVVMHSSSRFDPYRVAVHLAADGTAELEQLGRGVQLHSARIAVALRIICDRFAVKGSA